MHTEIRPVKTHQRKRHQHAIIRWLVALTTGLILVSGTLAAPQIDSALASELETTSSPATQKPTLRIAIADVLQEPLQNEIDMLRRAFNYAGYHLQLVPLPAQRGLRNAAAGELDGEFLRRREDMAAYSSLLAIDEPLRHVELWVWMLADSQCPNTQQDLHKFTMATVLSYGFIKTIPASSGSKKFQTNSVVSSLRVLQAGRVDYVMFDKRGMAHYKDTLGLDVKTCFEQPLSSINYFSFMHSKHRDKLPALTVALHRVKNEQSTNNNP